MELGSNFNLLLNELNYKEKNVLYYLREYTFVAFFDSGRSALKHLVSLMGEHDRILLPEYICASVINCFPINNMDFYSLNDDFTVNTESIKGRITSSTRYIYIMHYFGVLQPLFTLRQIREMADAHGCIIIEDTTHGFFSRSSSIGDYQICSIRKWLPIPNGGILYAKDDLLNAFHQIDYNKSTSNDRAYGMIMKSLFLEGILDCNEQYRRIFSETETQLEQQNNINLISDFSRYIITCIDTDSVRLRRRANYELLQSELEKVGLQPAIALDDDECPLVFPIRVSKRDALRQYLMARKIYCAVHWPRDGVMEDQRTFAVDCSDQLLSLPIDQRYGEEEMDYLAEVVKEYYR